MNTLLRKLLRVLRWSRHEADLREEIEVHRALRQAALERDGLGRDAAARASRLAMGNVTLAVEDAREVWALRTIDSLRQDLRIAVRSLLRAPVLTAAIVTTVGLGLGATAAIFSAVDAALLRPLPYAEPQQLVRIYTDTPPFKFRFSAADYLAFTEQQTRFAQSATYTDRSVSFFDGDTAELVRTRVVSWGFFSLLGITPFIGRDFTEQDGRVGHAPIAIASHAFWRQRLGSDALVIGRPLRLDGTEYTLVGVLPPSDGPLEQRYDLFLIQQFTPPTRKGPFLYSVIARLPRGADRTMATGELHAINRAMFPVWKSSYQDDKATWNMEDLKTGLVGDVHTLASLALAAVGLVWVLACANASNLLIARVTSRRADLAVRSALGASRGRLLRHLLAESALLAAGATALGLIAASAGMSLLQTYGAEYFPRAAEIRFDAPMAWFVSALAISSALLFGLVPALQAIGGTADGPLRSTRTVAGGTGARRLRRGLVAAQFAIATPLLIVAALLLASLDSLRRVDLGFDTAHLLTASIRLPGAQYSDTARVSVFWDEITRRVERLPGVAAVAFSDGLPPNNVGNQNNFDLEQYPTPAGRSQPVTAWVAVSADYVRTLGLTLVEGRLLDERDAQQENLLSVIVDRAWARRFFPNESAVGKRLREGGCTTCPWTTVVGVVSDVKYAGLDKPDDGTVYAPLAGRTSRFVVVRTKADPRTLATPLRLLIRELEPLAPLSDVATMDALVDQSLARPQSLSLLVTGFAAVALVLSAIGIYGVMAYYVQQQGKEICIRMALGGGRADVARLVVGQGMGVVGLGIAVGLALALTTTRLVSNLLFGVGALDPAVYVSAASLFVAVAFVACVVPAFRAVRLQPATVLRNE